nr:MAG TPA: hypothetical protein [Caudoviricetes sp.]
MVWDKVSPVSSRSWAALAAAEPAYYRTSAALRLVFSPSSVVLAAACPGCSPA